MFSRSLRLKRILKYTAFQLYEEGDFMSIYTEAEHAIALSDTLYWIEHPPMTPKEHYAYGLYQYRLKDYSEAFHWFSIAASDGVEDAWFDMGQCLLPDNPQAAQACFKNAWNYYCLPSENPEVLYRRAWMLRYGCGTEQVFSEAYNLFQTVADHYRELTPADFDICCEYSLEGSGICADSTKASPISHCKLPAGAALFELAKYFLEGLSPVDKNIENGRSLLKKAYDFHCEEALFYDFNLFGGNYNTYEYQDDIRELYSFRIGQYGRVCDINPSKETYLRLIQTYEKGYPGDNAERRLDFAKKAAPLYKKMEALK